MNIFISYSSKNLSLVNQISKLVGALADFKYWDKDKEYGEHDWSTIRGWIDKCDLVLVILTSDSKDNRHVGVEIGYAQSKQKNLMAFVSDQVPKTELGSLSGTTYVTFDEKNPEFSHTEMFRAISARKIKKAKDEGNLLLAIALIVGVVLVSKK